MATTRPRFERALNILGFVIAIVFGIACGYAFSAADALEERLHLRSSAAAKQAAKRM